ncbi:ATP-binding protein [Clostridium sp.]|uniref:ATP-binding protein n=1 Tax=Clostridium sp. TaxID=1506 RepID=UPI00283D35BE|nr:GHKL domain-containing protein [Clostridium sp.]MDR3595862.1 GHKL domain-containing protein [Clostridium sp.]
MLSKVILNGLDMINIIYLWAILSKKNSHIFKLLSSIIAAIILTTISEQLGFNFVIEDILIIMVIKIIYRINIKEIILGFLLVLLTEMSLQLIVTLVIEKFIFDNTIKIIIIELIILISTIIFSKTNLGKNIDFKNIDNSIIIYFVLICSIYTIVFKIIWNYDNNIILNNLFIISVILSVLVISQVLTYLYVVKLAKEKLKLKVSNEYNQVIDEIVQEIKQRQHDFVNYKNTIRGIVNVVDENDVKEAINNYIKDEDQYGDKINALIYIDNVVIRSIIYRNMCEFKKYNIKFKYVIENNVLDDILSYHEISNVLNNVLNNAFEEVMKKECIDKNIQVKIFNEGKTSHLIIKNKVGNHSNINLNEMFTRGYSTKDIGTRGYGLYNVQSIINLHRGHIKVNLEGGEIIFDIYFDNSLE